MTVWFDPIINGAGHNSNFVCMRLTQAFHGPLTERHDNTDNQFNPRAPVFFHRILSYRKLELNVIRSVENKPLV